MTRVSIKSPKSSKSISLFDSIVIGDSNFARALAVHLWEGYFEDALRRDWGWEGDQVGASGSSDLLSCDDGAGVWILPLE